MNTDNNKFLLKIFIGEIDKISHQPLYEAIIFAAKEANMAGCTVSKGIMSFGASSRIHSAKLIELSEDLPIMIEIIDDEEKIMRFADIAKQLLDKSAKGGLIFKEKIDVIYYKAKKTG